MDATEIGGSVVDDQKTVLKCKINVSTATAPCSETRFTTTVVGTLRLGYHRHMRRLPAVAYTLCIRIDHLSPRCYFHQRWLCVPSAKYASS